MLNDLVFYNRFIIIYTIQFFVFLMSSRLLFRLNEAGGVVIFVVILVFVVVCCNCKLTEVTRHNSKT
jgi:hypothetical protein